MTEADDVPPRYDELAEGYARHWGPVIAPAAIALVDRLPAGVADGARDGDAIDVVDVGTGTGTLAAEVLRRWASARVTGIDPSPAMLELAGPALRDAMDAEAAARFEPRTAFADRLPLADASMDVAISSFVLQLVPDRGAALREIRRVLRPGGVLGWVTWLQGGSPFRGDDVVDEVLDDFGFDPPERDGRSGDPASAAAAAAATRRAGFGEVRAEASELVHHWTPAAYTAFITEFDEQSTFAELDGRERRAAEHQLLGALSRLTAEELTVRMPIVYVVGTAR
ncbi:MAG TPA: class I SAM-dependent methyltransferase [Candidatus Limnocylindrales bacterium]|jgi:SAM-dependent methyltransferase